MISGDLHVLHGGASLFVSASTVELRNLVRLATSNMPTTGVPIVGARFAFPLATALLKVEVYQALRTRTDGLNTSQPMPSNSNATMGASVRPPPPAPVFGSSSGITGVAWGAGVSVAFSV